MQRGGTMHNRRVFVLGLLSVAALGMVPVHRAAAQFLPPRPYGDDDEVEHRRYEERRREEEERRHAYYEQHRQGDRTFELEQRRNERVLVLQQQLARREIDRRQFDYGVAEIDRELNDRLYGR